jgi:hypothetical protein
MASAVLWLFALTIEYHYALQPPGDGGLAYYSDQILFFAALLGYLIMLLGLWKSKATGSSLFSRFSLGIFLAGIASLLMAQVVQWLTSNADFFLFPVGGVFQLVGGILSGFAVVTTKHWYGWPRFALLLQSLYYLFVLFLPIAILNQSPTQLTESLWQVTWFITSMALFSRSRNTSTAPILD